MVAMYVRTSTDMQASGLEAQERAILAYCAAQGIGDFKLYKDSGVSGTKVNRPGLDALMAEVKTGTVTSVIVYSFSRFARSVRQLLEALELFETKGISFISISEQLDTRTSTGKFVFTILAALAQMERSMIVDRVKCGLENAKAKGRYPGRPAKRNSELIRELASKGCKYSEIARLASVSVSTVSRELSGYFAKDA